MKEVTEEKIDVNELIAQRKVKLCELREKGIAFPNNFRRDVVAGELHAHYDEKDNAELEQEKIHVKVAGRIMLCRIMGKASFIQIQDMSGRIQCYLRRNELVKKGMMNLKNGIWAILWGSKVFYLKLKLVS